MASPRALLHRRRPRAAAAWRALLLAAAAATATTQRCSAFQGWAVGSAGPPPCSASAQRAAAHVQKRCKQFLSSLQQPR
eukprot:5925146-Alexandrium_andersonii.AAC.1